MSRFIGVYKLYLMLGLAVSLLGWAVGPGMVRADASSVPSAAGTHELRDADRLASHPDAFFNTGLPADEHRAWIVPPDVDQHEPLPAEPIAAPSPTAAFAGMALLGLVCIRRRRTI